MPGLTATDRHRFQVLDARLERTQTLAAGDTGAAVRALENVLVSLGFTPGTPDTSFEARTRGTLKNFQSSMGLEPTGTLDRKTLEALQKALEGKRTFAGGVVRGQKGDAVARAERQLDRLGYDVGTKDGIADLALSKAITAFKADQGEFDNGAGLLSAKGLEVLGAESKAVRHDPYRGRKNLTLEQHRQDGVLAELSSRQNPDGTVGIGEGAKRPAIEMLQLRLKAAGFDPKRSDGVFDERTRGALERFQAESGVAVTGRLDPATWKRLKHTLIDTDQAAAPKQRVGERSWAVRRTERLLQKAGFDTGTADNLYTAATARAVREFERRTNRRVDGELGTNDLAALKKLANNPFPEPKSDYRRVVFRDGEVLNRRTIQMLEQAEAWAAKHGVPKGWALYQGSYSTDVGASANTHAGGGAIDIKTSAVGKTARQQHVMVEALRRAGFAAWNRPTMSPPHIHAIAIGDREMSSDARDQVREYFAGGDGLFGSVPDPHRDIGRPLPAWARRFA